MSLKLLLAFFIFILIFLSGASPAFAQTPAAPQGLSYQCSTDGSKVTLKWKRVFIVSQYQLRLDKITGEKEPLKEWFRPDKGDQNPKLDGSECPARSVTTAETEACNTLSISPNSPYTWSLESLPGAPNNASREDGPAFTCVPQKNILSAPEDLKSTCNYLSGGVQVDFTWKRVPGAASYQIEWNGNRQKVTASAIPNYSFGGIQASETNWSWTIRAIGKDGQLGNIKGGSFKCPKPVEPISTTPVAPPSQPAKPVRQTPAAPESQTTTTSPTTTTQPSSAPVPVTNTTIPSPSASIIKKAVKIVINNQDVTDKDFAKIKVTDSNTATTIDLRVEITYSDGSVGRSVVRFNYNPPTPIASGSAPTNLQIKCDPSGKKVLITWDADAKAANGYLLRLDKNPPSWNYDRVNNDDAPILAGRTDVDFSIDPNTPYLADVLTIPAGLTDDQKNKYNPADNLHLKQSFNCAAQSQPTSTIETAPSSAPVVQTNAPTPAVKSITCQKLERDGRNSGKILAPNTVTEVSAGQAFNIVASIVGDDGRRDNIKWSATGGTFNGSWDVVDWVAPSQNGEYKVSMSIDGVNQPSCTTTFKVTGSTLGVSARAKSKPLDILLGWWLSILHW